MDKMQQIYNNLQSDPMFFPKQILGIKPWSRQRKAIKYVMDKNATYNKTTIRGCHGFGKSFISGNIILQFLLTYKPSIVLSTAPTFRQVEKAIWKEVRTSYNNARIPLGGKLADGAPLLQIVKDQWYAMGLSTSEGDKFQGFHEENILVVVDEAAGVPESIFVSIDALLTSANAKLLIIGNPTSTAGTFKKSFEETGWNKIAVSAFDTPNFTYYGITEQDIKSGLWYEKMKAKDFKLPYPKMITPQWVEDKYKRWRPGSILYDSRVRGNFVDAGSDTLIPLAWIEAAQSRWEELEYGTETAIGVDVAEYGRDSSVAWVKSGRKLHPAKTFSKLPVMQLVGYLVILFNAQQASYINVDTIGVGTGVEGRLDELGIPTNRVNVAEGPGGVKEEETAKFINKRAQFYWGLRELLDPENPNAIGLPQDDELVEELMATKYKINSSGKIQIIPKDDIKEIIGRSPDKADALMIACAPPSLMANVKVLHKAGTW